MRVKAKRLEENGSYAAAERLRKEAKRITAGLVITQMVKLQQICGGYVVDDDGELHPVDSCKMDRLRKLLTTKIKFPVVVFCKYTEERREIEYLFRRLGISYKTIHGGIKDKKNKKLRTEAQVAFQTGKVDGIICQVRAGGVGIDLFVARDGILYSTTFSWIDFDQLRKRIRRRGQVNPTRLFWLYAKDSIDEDIYSTIILKQSVTKKVFKHIKRRSTRNG